MGKILIGKDAICKYLEVSKNIFYKLLAEGMPVSKGVGGWRSHTDILDEYFKGVILNDKKKQSP